MFGKIVKNQYVGKAKIDFTINGRSLDGKNLIGDIGIPFIDSHGIPFTNMDYHMPDYYILGDVSDISTMELIPKDIGKTKVLYITGIPKEATRLDSYQLKGVLWSSYYEDKYRGYLFQMVDFSTPVEMKEPKLENIKIKLITDDSTRVYRQV